MLRADAVQGTGDDEIRSILKGKVSWEEGVVRTEYDRFRGTAPLVLVVEDDETQSALLSEAVRREGIRCRVCSTPGEGYRLAVLLRPDMFIIDVNLEVEGDGFDLVDQIREMTLAPILILSGRATRKDDVRMSVERRATAYLNKTSAPPAVAARYVREQLISLGKIASPRMRLGKLVLDVKERKLFFEGRQAALTPILAELTACLMVPPGGRKPSEFLARKLYNDDSESAVISIRTHITRLRTLLGELSPALEISGRRNFGYCFLHDGVPLGDETCHQDIVSGDSSTPDGEMSADRCSESAPGD